jgi:exopolysaccharide biosynthesis polyprenyl glycosylphosphotransferase
VTDAVVVAWALMGAHVIRFGTMNPGFTADSLVPAAVAAEGGYITVSVALWTAWNGALALSASRDRRVIGAGPEEYRRVVSGTFRLFGILAILAFALQLPIARGYLIVALPMGLLGLVASRWQWRQWLHVRRRRGGWAHRAVVVADPDNARELLAELHRSAGAGFRVVGIVDPTCAGAPPPAEPGLEYGNGLDSVPQLVRDLGADAVAVAAGAGMPPQALRRLGWALEGLDVDLLVSPALTDVAGPRIHVRPVAGLPLLHVQPPEIPRSGRLLKSAFDRVVAACLLVGLLPVLLLAAAAVRLSGPGPVFYRQTRVGRDGTAFDVWKFRSMTAGADLELPALLARQGRAGTPLFKVDGDPRVTRVGRVLRRHSIDELPQLFNVLAGTMSLVGPRPQVGAEVALYDAAAARRLRSKPGLTGLWQVSGRSNLPWEEAVRLDLYYVENWSFSFDLVLLWRTVAVVLRGAGAR